MSSSSDSEDDNFVQEVSSKRQRPGQFVNVKAKPDNEDKSSNENIPEDEGMSSEIRAELKTMSFEDLMKLKEKLGAKVYDEAVFGQHRVREKKIKQQEFKRGNKNRPREMGVKRPVPLLGKEKILANEKTGPRDPRFDSNCGEYDAKKFKENFSFVSEIKERELVELKEQLKTSTDPKEQKKIKYLIQRMQNQNTEQKKLKIRQEVLEEHKLEIKKAKKEFKKPHFTTDRERKTEELVKQYLDLKNSGQLNKHLEKRRKKNAQRDRKKFSFD